jgi:pilus assembly protein FimV
MVRKLALSIALATASSQLFALGLGNIDSQSFLNQPFKAEIPIVAPGDYGVEDIKARLASAKQFDAAGLIRYQYLSQLKFETSTDANGDVIIKVKTREPIKEPFVDFLVELNWPKGRILREFTVLLDPPILDFQPPAQSKPVAVKKTPSQKKNEKSVTPAPRPTPQVSSRSYTESSQYGPTSARDTLWTIAQKHKSSDVSIHQMMASIFEANPDAFRRQNINNLKRGQVLNIPSSSQVDEQITQQQALQLIATHNSDWAGDGPGTRPTGAVTATQNKVEAPMVEEPAPKVEGKLRIVSDDEKSDGSPSYSAAAQSEAVATLEKENAELSNRLEMLESMLQEERSKRKALEEQLGKPGLEIEDAGLSEVTQPGSESAENDIGSETNETVEPEVVVPEESATLSEQAADSSEQPSETAQADSPSSDTENGEEASDNVEDSMVASEVDEVQPSTEPAPTPIAKPAPKLKPDPKENNIVDMVLGNDLLLAAGGGVLVLLGLLGLLYQRRRAVENQEFEDFTTLDEATAAPEAATAPQSKPEAPTTPAPVVASSADEELSDDETDELVESISALDEVFEEEQEISTDPIGEADIYIAYGRYDQAEQILRATLENDPQKSEVRVKLLECLAQSGNLEGFTEEANAVKPLADQDVALADEVISLFKQQWPEQALPGYIDEIASPEEPVSIEEPDAPAEESASLDFGHEDFDIGDTASLLGGQESTKEEESDAASGGGSADLPNLDFSLGDSESDEPPAEDLSSSLGENFSDDPLGSPVAEPADEPELSGLDDFDTGSTEDVTLDSFDSLDEDFSFDDDDASLDDIDEEALSDIDEVGTKLDLARAYVDMGDVDGAKEILNEVIADGNDEQRGKAETLLAKL